MATLGMTAVRINHYTVVGAVVLMTIIVDCSLRILGRDLMNPFGVGSDMEIVRAKDLYGGEEDYVTAPPRTYVDDDILSQTYVEFSLLWEKPRQSPYELRYPDDDLPEWAKKDTRLLPVQHLPPKDKAVCFVHLGKTGGSTVGCSLGFRVHCPKDISIPPGKLAQYTTHMIHNGVNDCVDDMPYYLFTLRNPLERVRSAYIYDRRAVEATNGESWPNHGQAAVYLECPFYTLNDLALRGLAKSGTAPDFCKRRARNALQGIIRSGYHLYYNHGWFLEASKALKSNILVIRTEYMVADWNTAEVALSGNDTSKVVRELPTVNEGSVSRKLFDDLHLTAEARVLLCEALCTEIQHYKRILQKAINLSREDKAVSMEELSQTCPREARSKTCRP